MDKSMEFSRLEYWSGLPFPSPGDLTDPGIRPRDRTQVSHIAGRRFNLCTTRCTTPRGCPKAGLLQLSWKESACNARDLCSIPRSGRSTGEGKGYPLHYSWASLVAQLVKNLPVMRETWVQSLGWKDPLEKGTATHSSILVWRLRSLAGYSPWGLKESD